MKKFYNFNMVPRVPDVQYEGGQQIDGQPVNAQVSAKEFSAKFKSKRECYNFLAAECSVYLPPYGKCFHVVRLTLPVLQTT